MTRILIDIKNSIDILKTILEIFHTATGWNINSNVRFDNDNWIGLPNNVPRYFVIDLENKLFSWACLDQPADIEYQPIETVEDAISIVEFALANVDFFKINPEEVKKPVEQKEIISYNNDYNNYSTILINNDDHGLVKMINNSWKKYYDDINHCWTNSYEGLISKDSVSKYYKKFYNTDYILSKNK